METVLQTLTNGVILGANYRKEEFFNPKFENSNKLNLVVSTQIRKEFVDFSIWEKLFVSNFYGKNENGIILEKPSNKKTKVEEIKLDINREFEKLCAIANDFAFLKFKLQIISFLIVFLKIQLKDLREAAKSIRFKKFLKINKTLLQTLQKNVRKANKRNINTLLI
jgi:hypothetical protein